MLFSYCIILSFVLFLSQSEINTCLISCSRTNLQTPRLYFRVSFRELTRLQRNCEIRNREGRCERKLTFASYWWTTPDPPPQTEGAYSKQEFWIEWRFLQRIKANRSWGKGSGFCGFDIHLMTGFLVKLSYQILSGEFAPANTARGPYPKSFGLATICASWHLHGCGWFIMRRHSVRIINSDMVLLARPYQHLMCGSNSYNIYCYLKVW